jgi:integrase
MALKALTSVAVAAAKPRRNAAGELVRTEYPDRGSGLYLVVQPGGAKSWCVRYRHNGRPRKFTLGPAGDGGLTLAAAREAAAAARHSVERGVDPAAEWLAAQKPAKAAERSKDLSDADAVETLVAQFMEIHAKRKTREITWISYERIFRRLVVPPWRGRTVHEVKRRDVIALVENIAANTPHMANRLLAVLSKFFSWLVARDVLEMSPCAGVERPFIEVARDRTLSDDEIVKVWSACADLDRAGDYAKLLLLTGARRAELGAARWDELDPDRRTLTIPASRSKNRRAHVIPLVSVAWDIVAAQPRLADSPYLFPAKRGGGPLANYHHLKDRIDARVRLARPWRFHDLRRSAASGMQRLGVRVEVIESCLNYTSGSFAGIVGIYQRHDYTQERRAAHQRWADHIEQIVSGCPASVVPLRRGRA